MTIDDRLEALYASLPALECLGLCIESCGTITMGLHEQRRVERQTGEPLRTMDRIVDNCPYLEDRRCSVYEVRPLVCRLWGLVDSPELRCEYGCTPERWLTRDEALALMRRSLAISGGKEVTTLAGGLDDAERQYREYGFGR